MQWMCRRSRSPTLESVEERVYEACKVPTSWVLMIYVFWLAVIFPGSEGWLHCQTVQYFPRHVSTVQSPPLDAIVRGEILLESDLRYRVSFMPMHAAGDTQPPSNVAEFGRQVGQ